MTDKVTLHLLLTPFTLADVTDTADVVAIPTAADITPITDSTHTDVSSFAGVTVCAAACWCHSSLTSALASLLFAVAACVAATGTFAEVVKCIFMILSLVILEMFITVDADQQKVWCKNLNPLYDSVFFPLCLLFVKWSSFGTNLSMICCYSKCVKYLYLKQVFIMHH